jgi:N-acetylglutamate synthase
MEYIITDMTLDRYDELLDFWSKIEGIRVSDDDKYENLRIYLERNPDSNFIVLHNDKIIATIKCSDDGRKGFLHHMAVDPEYRKMGIAKELVDKCLDILRKKGMRQTRLFVLDSNKEALKFWKHIGFEEKVYDYRTYQKNIDE